MTTPRIPRRVLIATAGLWMALGGLTTIAVALVTIPHAVTRPAMVWAALACCMVAFGSLHRRLSHQEQKITKVPKMDKASVESSSSPLPTRGSDIVHAAAILAMKSLGLAGWSSGDPIAMHRSAEIPGWWIDPDGARWLYEGLATTASPGASRILIGEWVYHKVELTPAITTASGGRGKRSPPFAQTP